MPRSRRRLEPGLLHHVWTHAVDEEDVFRGEEDRTDFLVGLTDIAVELGWQVHTYCLMGNHVHLVVDTPAGGLDIGMQRLLGEHAVRVNDRYGRRGHLFGGRYGSKVVDTDAYHAIVMRYVASNPVKDGFCRHPLEWPWSAHAALAERVEPPPFLSFAGRDRLFGGADVYATYVGGGDERRDPLDQLLAVGGPDGIRSAVLAGFSQRAIAVRLGVSHQVVWRALQRTGAEQRGQTPLIRTG